MSLHNHYLLFKFLVNHPLTRDSKLGAIKRFIAWQLKSRTIKKPFVVPFIEDSKLWGQRGLAALPGNIYVGLQEYEDMIFLLHFLREGDIFFDIGANIGTYVILASSVNKALTTAIEPVTNTFQHLKNNISLNQIEQRTTLYNIGLGSKKGKLFFFKIFDSMNRVANNVIKPEETEEVNIDTLDFIAKDKTPALLKIDVEGFEMEVLRGGEKTLSDNKLKAILIELNGSCNIYGINDIDIHNKLLSYNFHPVAYNPFTRTIENINSPVFQGNLIYIRDDEWVKNRLASSRKYKVLTHEI